jgi:hypothetical protein
MGVSAADNAKVDRSVHNERQTVVAQVEKRPRKGATPKAPKKTPTSGNLAPCQNNNLDKAVKIIKPLLATYNASADKDDTNILTAVLKAMNGLSGNTPIGMLNAGACLIENFQGDKEIVNDVINVESTQMIIFASSAEVDIASSNKPLKNNQDMQQFIRDPQGRKVQEYIEVQKDLIIQSLTDPSKGLLDIHRFVEHAISGKMSPVLFNAVVFRCTEAVDNISDLNRIKNEITANMTTNGDKPPFQGNTELKNWANATHGVLRKP